MGYLYCDVSLPVPLDQPFTYSLPLTLQHRVETGCRLMVPFGTRKLTGVVLSCHNDPPPGPTKDAFRLVDAEPVIAPDMLALARWISGYYCAPLGEVLRTMLPLGSEIRSGKIYTLTDSGRDAARQLFLTDGPEEDLATQILKALDSRSLSEAYFKKKFPLGEKVVRALEKKGFVLAEQTQNTRDPLRSPAEVLQVQLHTLEPEGKFPKAERELIAYLQLHPGVHNLAQSGEQVRDASTAARALARKGIVELSREETVMSAVAARPPHSLNAEQQNAFDQIARAIDSRKYAPFLLHGVTGSGKTEVYLNAIDAALAAGRNALLLVPEIALTPQMAGQFFSRWGNRVAILHSAFSDSERVEQWRKIRSGKAGVVVGTRSGVFAPVRDLGLIVVDEEHDGSYKQEEVPRYNGRDVAIVRAQAAGACIVLGSATSQPGKPIQCRSRQVHAG